MTDSGFTGSVKPGVWNVGASLSLHHLASVDDIDAFGQCAIGFAQRDVLLDEPSVDTVNRMSVFLGRIAEWGFYLCRDEATEGADGSHHVDHACIGVSGIVGVVNFERTITLVHQVLLHILLVDDGHYFVNLLLDKLDVVGILVFPISI